MLAGTAAFIPAGRSPLVGAVVASAADDGPRVLRSEGGVLASPFVPWLPLELRKAIGGGVAAVSRSILLVGGLPPVSISRAVSVLESSRRYSNESITNVLGRAEAPFQDALHDAGGHACVPLFEGACLVGMYAAVAATSRTRSWSTLSTVPP